MIALTLKQARESLWDYATTATQAGASAAEKLVVDNIINQVQERFITQGKWRGSIVRARFGIYDNQFTLPDSLSVALKVAPVDAEGSLCLEQTPYNQWYSILGPGDTNFPGCVPYDLGEGFATFRDPVDPFYVRAICEQTETAKTILLRGLDTSRKMIYTAPNVEGVSLTLSGTTTTTQEFSALSYWVKPAATNGVVRLYAVDVTSGDSTLFCVITPGKTVSNYRRYSVPWGGGENTVAALCKRAYVPAVADNDPVTPGLLGALKLGIISLKREDAAAFNEARTTMDEALSLLEGDRQEWDGDLRPTFSVDSAFSAGSVPNLY